MTEPGNYADRPEDGRPSWEREPAAGGGAGPELPIEDEVGSSFDALWASAPEIDADAVWAKVRAGAAETPQRRWAWWDPRGWRPESVPAGAPGWRPAPRLVTAFAVVLAAVAISVAALVTQGGSGDAALVAEAEGLSGFASRALADDLLTPEERSEIGRRAESFALALTEDPSELSRLSDTEVARVAETLEAVLRSIDPHEEADGDGVTASVGLIEEVTSQARDEQAARGVTSAPAAAPTATAPPPAAPSGEAAASPAASPIQPAVVLPVCAGPDTGAASECDRTFRAVVVACQSAASGDGLRGCKERVQDAKHACNALASNSQRRTCDREVREIEAAARNRVLALQGNLGRGNDRDGDDEDGGD